MNGLRTGLAVHLFSVRRHFIPLTALGKYIYLKHKSQRSYLVTCMSRRASGFATQVCDPLYTESLPRHPETLPRHHLNLNM